ncbi:hypothetical protein SARC_16648 [Sphaeroforma arctica JP610]|uniref:Uncharacterized protein n=1 Tax=Sphaeroforma arctica JP610 TaxID=667725 RepID=A0A0L0F2H3_9EUKA|nr:hypothetical protein SARC_16648 [Sphaeroforma arctica JP610]KNC70816.1 hypothetical protein SARC_16648 [Sphaeroforma arctica JP610]|eukprot:XP_014144718.1 hypothetical protein SARC_16648 [Sphaeroforma arctica JP610]
MLSDFGTSAGDTLNDGFTLNEPKQGMRVLIKTQWDSGVSAHESVQTHVNDSTQRSLQACTRKGERESGALNEKVDPNQCVAWSVRNLIAWTSPALSLSKQGISRMCL